MYHCVLHLLHTCIYLNVRTADSNRFSGFETVGVLGAWLTLRTSGCSMACGVLSDEGRLSTLVAIVT